MKRLKKWEAARDEIAPFLIAQNTEGLVLTPDSIDLSGDSDSRVLRKATLVYVFCCMRLLGVSLPKAQEVASTASPNEEGRIRGMSSQRCIRRHVAECFEHRGFYESKRGK
jgi:hypothetical protein